MALSRDVVIRLLGDASSAIAAQKAAADSMEISVSAYRKAEREYAKQQAAQKAAADSHRQSMKEAGQTAMILGGAMVAAFGIATKAAMEFDKSMSAVGAATMANAQQMGQLRQAALDAGAATMYSATEAAQAETELAKAGISVKDILGGGLKGALDLAAAGQLNVADAAGIAATAMQQFHLSGSQTSHVADLLAAGAGKAMGSVQDLSGALKYVGPVAAGMGISIEQTTGALAMFASQGILGEQAGTSLRGVISALSSPSKMAQQAMDDLGISVFDAKGNFIGLDGVAGQLHTAMSGLTEAERSAALGRIFGNEQLTAARVLYQQGAQGVQEWTKKVNDSGYAQEQAARLTDNLAGDIERLGGSISTVLIEGGSKATGVLRWLTQAAEDGVNAFGSLPEPIQATSFGFLGVVGAGTALLGLVGTLIPRIHEAREALRGLGAAGAMADVGIGKIGKVAGYGALAAAGIGIVSAVTDALTEKFDVVTSDATKLADSLERLGNTGKSTGIVYRLFGRDLQGLAGDMMATAPAINGFLDEFLFKTGAINAHGQLDFSKAGQGAIELQGDLNKLNAAFEQSQQNIKDTDGALGQMVNGGKAEAAAAAAMRLYDAWTKAGGTALEFKEKFPDTVAAMEAFSATSQTVVSDTGEITTGMGEAASAADVLKGAIDELNGVQMNQVDANIKWTETLKGVKIAADGGSASLDLNTKAGADNAAQFVDAAKRASDFAQAVADTSGLEAGRAALGNFRDALIDQAVKAGFSRDSVIALVDQLLRVPADTPTAVTLHDQATAGLNSVNDFLNRIDGKTAHTTVTNTIVTEYLTKVLGGAKPYSETGPGGNPIGLPPVRAAGGPVWPGQPFLVGEKGPELVQFGASGFVTPHDLSKRALSVGPGIPVGGGHAAGPAIDYGLLASALASVIPSRGDVNIGPITTQRDETGYELAERLAFVARTGR